MFADLDNFLPDKVFIAKKDSPLVIGKTADASVAASDIPAILDYTKDVYFLEDYEIAILNKGNVSFFDQYGNPIEKEITTIPYDNEAAQKAKESGMKVVQNKCTKIEHRNLF